MYQNIFINECHITDNRKYNIYVRSNNKTIRFGIGNDEECKRRINNE